MQDVKVVADLMDDLDLEEKISGTAKRWCLLITQEKN